MSETQISDAHGEAVDEDKRDFIFIATGAAAAAAWLFQTIVIFLIQ